MAVQKELHHKLVELEDALADLAFDLHQIHDGDETKLRKIADELRGLILFSSGTDGLLIRMLEHFGIDDSIMASGALAGDSFPADQGAVAVYRTATETGERKRVSFKKAVRTETLAVAAGNAVTADRLIKAVAQKIGKAHYDDKVGDELAALAQVRTNGFTPLVSIFQEIAHHTVELGNRVLNCAHGAGYTRRRPVQNVDRMQPHGGPAIYMIVIPEFVNADEGQIKCKLEVRPNHPIGQRYPDQSAGPVKLEQLTLLPSGLFYAWVYCYGRAYFFVRWVQEDWSSVWLEVGWNRDIVLFDLVAEPTLSPPPPA